MVKDALDLAGQIAKKSPVATAGIKHNLNFSRDHSAQQGLEYMVSTTENLKELHHCFVRSEKFENSSQKKLSVDCRLTVGGATVS